MEVARKLVIVYYNSPHCLRKIANFGNLIYHSNKLHYAYIYVDEKKLNSTIESLQKIKGVTKVEISLTEMSDFTFSI